jgi:hypothetical protein
LAKAIRRNSSALAIASWQYHQIIAAMPQEMSALRRILQFCLAGLNKVTEDIKTIGLPILAFINFFFFLLIPHS